MRPGQARSVSSRGHPGPSVKTREGIRRAFAEFLLVPSCFIAAFVLLAACLDDGSVSRGENEQRQDQLRDIAERDVEQPADRRARARGQMLGCMPDPLRQRNDGRGGRDEDDPWRGSIQAAT